MHVLFSRDFDPAQLRAVPADDLASVGHALAIMDALAVAVDVGYVDVSFISRAMGRSYSSAIESAKPYLEHLARVRGYQPYSYAIALAGILGRMSRGEAATR